MQLATSRRLGVVTAAVSLLALGAARPAAAQSHDGFLFGAPPITLTLRGGFDRASAGSDLFGEAIQNLSLSRGSFSGATLGADLAFRLGDRAAIVTGVGLSTGGAGSHYRGYTDTDDREIEQTTSFRRIPLTVGVRAYLTPAGRSIGRYAWIPSKMATYVGVGGGAMYYRFAQSGSFIVEPPNNLSVFDDQLQTSGWAPTAHALAGVDYTLSPHLALTGEARYTWARGDVNTDYVGYNRIDLSGVAATVGLSVRF